MGLKFQHLNFFKFFRDFFENFSILEVEIGGNGPGILGVNAASLLKKFHVFKVISFKENSKLKYLLFQFKFII
jgi:hypothetical protein